MEQFQPNPYSLIISASVIIILSFIYKAISKKINIPDAVLLILTGMIVKQAMNVLKIGEPNLFPVPEILGIIGLIMTILDATLHLEFDQQNLSKIGRSFGMAFLGTIGTALAIAGIFYYHLDSLNNFKLSLLYAMPLAILSASIVTSNIDQFTKEQRLFHRYESAFSDIIGITAFFMLQDILLVSETTNATSVGWGSNLILTTITSLITSYTLIFLLQNAKANVRLFLLISVVLLLYAIGKLLNLSSLTIILIFGMVLSNGHLLLKSYLGKYINPTSLKEIRDDYSVVTIEANFVVRTFFFVIFGFSIVAAVLFKPQIILISSFILVSLYIIRYILFQIFGQDETSLQVYMAPRGVITILLFFAIPPELKTDAFQMEILFFIITISGLLMTYSLLIQKKRQIHIHADDDNDLIAPPDSIYRGFKYKGPISLNKEGEAKKDDF